MPDGLAVGAGEEGRAGVVELLGLHLELEALDDELLHEGLDLMRIVPRERLVGHDVVSPDFGV